MGKEQVIKEVEAAIVRVCADIKQKKGRSGADKLDALSKLLNSYNRLTDKGHTSDRNPEEYGDPEYYERLKKLEGHRRNVIR